MNDAASTDLPPSANRRAAGGIARPSGRQRSRSSARAEALLRAWHDMATFGPVPSDDACRPDGPGADLVEKALAHLLEGAAGGPGASPRRALESLRQAEALFRSLSMQSLCQATRVEAAWQMREGGYPALALQSIDTPQARENLRFAQCVHALRSLCLLDLGRLDEAARSMHEAVRVAAMETAEHSARSQWYVRTACLQWQASQGLLRRRFDCHLTEPVLEQRTAAAPGGHEASLRAEPPTPPAGPLCGTPALFREQRALELLAEAARHDDAPGLGPRLMRLIADCALQPDSVSAQTWLWLGTTQWLLGNPKLAAAVLERAVTAARSRGQSRLEHGALIDLVHAREHAGLTAEALAAHKALRRLERHLDAAVEPPPQVHAQRMQWDGPDCLAVRSPHLGRALRLLATVADPFTVESLVSACGVSRRTLEKVFRAELGQSVAECLRGRRLSLVQARLAQGTDSIKRIALESGYPSASALCHDFKRAIGTTPAAYRARMTGAEGNGD